MAQAYRVCAPYVTVRVAMAAGGETILGFYEGGLLPGSAVKESVESLLVKGMIEETDGPTPEESDAENAKIVAEARERSDKAAEEVAAENEKKAAERAEKARQKAAERPASYTPEQVANLTGQPAPAAAPERDAGQRPSASASKADWVAYAVTYRDAGVSEQDARAEAEGMSKQALIDEFGG